MPKKAAKNKEIENLRKPINEKIANTANVSKKIATQDKTKNSNINKLTSKQSNKTLTSNKKNSKVQKNTKKVTNSTKSSSRTKKETKKSISIKSKSSTKKTIKPQNTIIEYYDLPNKYNQTIVKILAQTPKTLFIYWEISDDDIKNYKKQYGEDFFEKTKPVLIIHNNTLKYSFEVEINDFANSWYLHINDSKSDYKVELGRRPIEKNNNMNLDYLYISSSNEIQSPNDHILFNPSQKMVYFRNVKTYQKIEKPTSSLSFIQNMGKIYNIYDLYKELYKNQDDFDYLSNPSSQFK